MPLLAKLTMLAEWSVKAEQRRQKVERMLGIKLPRPILDAIRKQIAKS